MKIEIKTKSLKEIIKKCETLGWEIKDVSIEYDMFEDIRNPDELYVKLFLKNKKIK